MLSIAAVETQCLHSIVSIHRLHALPLISRTGRSSALRLLLVSLLALPHTTRVRLLHCL